MEKPRIMAHAWYAEAQWAEIRAVSEDRDKMPESFAVWLGAAEAAVKHRQEVEGLVVHKMHVDVDLLVAWARGRNLRINASTRALFAVDLLAERLHRNRQGE